MLKLKSLQRERLDYRVAENRINPDDYAKATGGGGKADNPSDERELTCYKS